MRSVRLQTRTVAVVILALTALACLTSLAHAGMGEMGGSDCFGPGCPQQITCARADQVSAPPSRLLSGSLAAFGSSVPALSLAQTRVLVPAPPLVAPIRQSVCPLAPRSPPAA